ncbi:MAG: TrbI/VirB10 family protein [Pseudomonadota bacterium]
MSLLDRLRGKPAQDQKSGALKNAGDPSKLGGIEANDATAKRQRLALIGGAVVTAGLGTWFVLDEGESEDAQTADAASGEITVSTDAIMNRQVADREWMGIYEHQNNAQDKRLDSVEQRTGRVEELEAQVQALQGENAAMVADGTRVLESYERENQRLRQRLEDAQKRPSAPGPRAAAAAMGVAQPPGVAGPVAAPPPVRTKTIQLASFDRAEGTAARIDPKAGATSFTDSPNYLPPNSIAKATVVVGVDATTNTRSQSDPLPVLLRITGPARSVYEDGRLLATRVQGCMVNGAAYGDLSSEKVYVKLQRMTCPQPGGRFAVSEVKGFIAFGGKVGVRGRVVSREGGLVSQAFLAGLVGSAGTALSQGFNQPIITGQRENPDLGEVGLRALGGGAQQAGTTVSDYLIERAEQYQPVIEMPTGAEVEVVFLDGTFVRN